tara:strand:- start:24 stop:362 length:339 start_codon:yes stop_codon:yes gene_type:complete
MALDHEAIYKAYAGTVVSIDDSAGAFDASGNSVTLDQTKVDAARATIDAEAAATLYQRQRTGEARTTDTIYASIGDQLDMLFKAIDADSDLKTKFAAWHTHISAVKAKYPKP